MFIIETNVIGGCITANTPRTIFFGGGGGGDCMTTKALHILCAAS